MPQLMDQEKGKIIFQEAMYLLGSCCPNAVFLIQGTALGAYRDGGKFVPDEKDIDLALRYEHFVQYAPRIANRFIRQYYDVRTVSHPFTRPRVLVLEKEGIKIDLTSYVRWGDKRFCCNGDRTTKPYAIVHNAKILEHSYMVKMHSIDCIMPGPPEDYLAAEYGPTWNKHTPGDSKSRTRDYTFTVPGKIPADYLEQWDDQWRI